MASARIARFVTEAAPPQFVSVIRQRASQMLDTIKEDEKEFSSKDSIISPRGASASLPCASSSVLSLSPSPSNKKDGCFSTRPSPPGMNFISLWTQAGKA